MKKRVLFILICLALSMMLCGCAAGFSVENLLTPPKLNAEQAEIYEALINTGGAGVKLKYPRGGDYRSAFVLKDIDDEMGEEALVFYESHSVQTGESGLRLKILDKSDGEWHAMYDMACVGSEVDSISFARLGGGELDIILRCSSFNQTEKTFSVLNYKDGELKERYASSYSCLEVIDLNSDGLDELVSVVTDKANKISTAMMFTNSENGFEKLSETQLCGGAADYVGVTKGKLNENIMALFLDYSVGSGQFGTDVVYCYGSRLINPDSTGANSPNSVISRFTNDYLAEISCRDIDGDGYIEIPSTTPFPGYETLTKPEQLCAVQWYTVTDDNFTLEHYGYYSNKYNFALLFPSRWRGVVSAVVNSAANEIIFISYDVSSGLEVNEYTELIRIRAVDKDDTEGLAASEGMRRLGESDEAVYCFMETAGYKAGNLVLTESELTDCFIIL